MGQKVNPIGLRLGVNRTWDSTWYADKNYADQLHEDLKLRKFVKDRLYSAGISKVVIERAANRIKITIHTARPGMVIGRGGVEADALKKDIEKKTGKQVMELFHKINAEGRTIIMITHDAHIAAQAKRIVRILDGNIGEGGTEDA